MEILQDEGVAISLAIIILGFALGLPSVELGIFGLDFSEFPLSVISIFRIGLIALAVSVGLKPLEKNEGGLY